ncbi:MAG: PilZ domain-containing protein [Deltaproteobacteria bacterium]|nr:PilZ domain-containing protein [Deltaproteobacteria bacterium]
MAILYDGTEKRNHVRLEWKAPVQLSRGDVVVEGEIHNISLGGILVSSSLELRYGDKVTATFYVPKLKAPVVAKCAVRWISADKECGLNFIGLKAIETWAVSHFVRQLFENHK